MTKEKNIAHKKFQYIEDDLHDLLVPHSAILTPFDQEDALYSISPELLNTIIINVMLPIATSFIASAIWAKVSSKEQKKIEIIGRKLEKVCERREIGFDEEEKIVSLIVELLDVKLEIQNVNFVAPEELISNLILILTKHGLDTSIAWKIADRAIKLFCED